eukprot:174368-Rhodomonas_salina.2
MRTARLRTAIVPARGSEEKGGWPLEITITVSCRGTDMILFFSIVQIFYSTIQYQFPTKIWRTVRDVPPVSVPRSTKVVSIQYRGRVGYSYAELLWMRTAHTPIIHRCIAVLYTEIPVPGW